MLLPLAGSAGIGMVWGWLLGRFEGQVLVLPRTIPAITLASLTVAAPVLWFAQWQGLAFFGAAALSAFAIHLEFRRALRRRFEQPNSSKGDMAMDSLVPLFQTAQPNLQLLGAGCFGAIIGWYVYYINRYRKGDVQFSDLVTVLGVVGGSAVLTLFPSGTDLFGAYGIGLFAGFFSYFVVLLIMVNRSKNFDVDWFLDGRRIWPVPGYEIQSGIRPTTAPLEAKPSATGPQ